MRTRLFAVSAVMAVLVVMLVARLAAFQGGETRARSLDIAYATFKQDGVKPLDNTVDNDDLMRITSEVQQFPQQMVLCVGNDLAAAVKASALSFAMPDERVPAVAGSPDDFLWLAAYLGSDGSVPAAYQVRTIEVTGKTIRVAYEAIESATRSCDRLAYVVWVPVGPLEEGVYALELFDVVAAEVTLTRPWHVILGLTIDPDK